MKRKKILAFLVLSTLGAIFGYFAGKWGAQLFDLYSRDLALTLAIGYIPAFFIVIAVHELGHAWVGQWVGFDFRMYVVGPLMWSKESGVWKFKWNKNVNLAGGMVICVPTDSKNLRQNFVAYAAGGPLASLALAIVSGAAGWVIDILTTPSASPWSAFFFSMAFLSLAILIATIVPVHVGGFSSDGARILRLLRGGERARFEMLLLSLIAKSTGGTRPSDLNMDELNEANALARQLNAPLGVYLLSFLHQATFDRGDWVAAEEHLRAYIQQADQIPEGLRNSVWLDAAFFFQFAKNDFQEANLYWKKYRPTALIPASQVLATEAVILAGEGKDELAKSKAQEALKQIPDMMDQGVGKALCDRLQSFLQTLDERKQQMLEQAVG